VSEKWKESWLEDDVTTRFVVMPKNIRLWYWKAKKYVHVDYDLYPTKYQLTEKGINEVRKLYSEVANKKSSMSMSHLTAHLQIPIEHLEHVILTLMEILPNNLEDDPKLKEFEQGLPRSLRPKISPCPPDTPP
jgi:hypothetical protein